MPVSLKKSPARAPYADECIAYALAAGLVPLDNSQAALDRQARRARWERRKALKNARA